MDRKEFRRYMTLMAMRQKSVGVTLGPVEVKLYGDRATAKFTAGITGGPGFLPNQAQVYDIDTGECISNLSGEEALLETYFPVGALDASRGGARGPVAIMAARAGPRGVALR